MSYSDPSLLQADVVANSIAINNSAASTTVITVPAGRVFKCNITASLCNTGVAAATFDTISILTAGSGVYPAAGTVLLLVQTHANATAAEVASATTQDVIVRAPATGAVTINAQLSAAATTLNGTCSITGVLVG